MAECNCKAEYGSVRLASRKGNLERDRDSVP